MRTPVRPRPGFTLIELAIVMVIIGILIALVLVAIRSGVRSAEAKATIALIVKLDEMMNDRVDAVLNLPVDVPPIRFNEPLPAVQALAAVYSAKSVDPDTGAVVPRLNPARALAIATYDRLRSLFPDVFFVQDRAPTATAGVYPLNFAALPFRGSYAVPLGADGDAVPVTGVYGATYEAAGGLYAQLGYHPEGYDGADNNGDGFIDDAAEGLAKLSAAEQAVVRTRLGRHTHKTARAELLYATLVYGESGLGGTGFNPDEFTSREVQDTDGDGLLEFVDAWGEPLQYYRWPVFYRSDRQAGFPDSAKIAADLDHKDAAGQPAPFLPGPYAGVYGGRERNTLDPTNTLLAPDWWGSGYNDAPSGFGANVGGVSAMALTFMTHYQTLIEPLAAVTGATDPNTAWDRSPDTATGYYLRRGYHHRFLILSGGPDKLPGTAQCGLDYARLDDRAEFIAPDGTVSAKRDGSGAAVSPLDAVHLRRESQGGRVDLNRVGPFDAVPFGTGYRNDTNTLLERFAEDDLANHALQPVGGLLP